MPRQQVDPGDLSVSGNEERGRPAPVEVPLDENSSTMRRSKPGARPSATRQRVTIRRHVAILAVGTLGGAALSQGLAHSHQPTPSPPTTGAATLQPRHEDRTDFAPSNGDTVNKLLAGLDAITETEIARVAATDGPQQVARIQLLRQQQDDVRALIVTHYYGWLPYPMP